MVLIERIGRRDIEGEEKRGCGRCGAWLRAGKKKGEREKMRADVGEAIDRLHIDARERSRCLGGGGGGGGVTSVIGEEADDMRGS